MSKVGIRVILGVSGILLVVVGLYMFLVKEIDVIIRKDPTLSYQTSLTDLYGSRSKADIYRSPLGFKETVDYVESLKRPDYTQENTENMYAQLAYEHHEVLVYKAEESEDILVQVAALAYLRNNGYNHMYRSPRLGGIVHINNYHATRGYSSYGSSSSTSKNTSSTSSRPSISSTSVRQGSSGSRISIGGGTGFGK